MNPQEAKMREMSKQIQEEHWRKSEEVRKEFLSGELLRKINTHGHCDFIFEKLGQTVLQRRRPCEREKGHSGPHMFGCI